MTGEKENWQQNPETFTSKILVPFSWASPMSEITLPKVNVGWYARKFTVGGGKDWKGKNVYLIFGASDFHTKVWINGQFAGEHKGGYVPFEFNITSLLKKGNNQLVVMVEDEELDNRPSGKQYYGNAKGIWQTVYLEPRNEVYLSGIRFHSRHRQRSRSVLRYICPLLPSGIAGSGFRAKGNNMLFEARCKCW